ncbi:MAG: HIT family protein [Candidatus Izemoplasmataceae bacterium]
MKPCPFCSLEQKHLIHENQHMRVIFDGFPVTRGHALIIPRRHIASFFELNEAERDAALRAMDATKAILDERFNPDGYNIGVNIGTAAGQTVHHVHIHLIPRYKGDMEDPSGGVRGVIPNKQKYGGDPS